MTPRLLVLTAGYGEGHNAAARALVSACEARHGPGSARMVDVFALAQPRLNAISRRAYVAVINRAPRLWSAIYLWTDRSRNLPRTFALLRGEAAILARMIATDRPEALCSTYPVYAFLLARIARAGASIPPHFNVVTDSISINSLWWRSPCTGWFLPNADSADVLRAAGIDPSRIHESGFPVNPFFSEHAGEFSPPDLQTGAAPRILHIINSGTKNAVATARLLFAETDWEITCAVGRDEGLHRQLTQLAASRRRAVTILGWTDQIPRLLMTHHVVVSKAGGATTQEAIAARCPMLVSQIVPGQEEGNYELLRRHGAGALAVTPAAVLAQLQRAFHERGRVWQDWRNALATLARPNAAHAIVAHILGGTGIPARESDPSPAEKSASLPA